MIVQKKLFKIKDRLFIIECLASIKLGSHVNFSNQIRETKNCVLKLTIFY